MGMWWSWAEGTKWVRIRPFVEAPADREGAREQPERAGAGRVEQHAHRPAGGAPGGGGLSTYVPPYGASPTSAGWSRIRSQTNGTTTRDARPTVTEAGRQPCSSTIQAQSGRKTSCPEAPAAVRMPVTRPRRATNQRLVTVAANAIAIDPVPRPTNRPQ